MASVLLYRCSFNTMGSQTHAQHIGIIMDGNGRWAQAQELRRSEGHRAGVQKVNDIVRHVAAQDKIKHLTLYAFSHENWSRPKTEIKVLMELLKDFLVQELPTMIENNVKLTTIGNIQKLPLFARQALKLVIGKTRSHTGLQLNLALSYGGRDEIIRGIKKINPAKLGELDEALFASYLDTALMPEPDLIIRTGGEMRLSNFMLWQSAYAELAFTKTLWPEFTVDEFQNILTEFAQRDRRYGKVKL